MRKLGLEAIYPKPNLSKPGKDHLTYPYLLRGVLIEYSDQVWATDITYIRIGSGFIYLLVIMDWHSRFVIEMEVSNSLEASVFVETLKRALKKGKPEIFNSDQGSQFTAIECAKSFAGEQNPDQYGRTRTLFRQYFRRTIMAFGQTGRSLFKGIRRRLGNGGKFAAVF